MNDMYFIREMRNKLPYVSNDQILRLLVIVNYCWVEVGTKCENSLDRRKSVVVRSLTLLLFSLFFGVLSPFTLLYKVTTKLYNENGNGGGYSEFLIITDNYRQLTFHILRISHDYLTKASQEYLTSAMPTFRIYIGAWARAIRMMMMAIHPSEPRQLADSRAGRELATP